MLHFVGGKAQSVEFQGFAGNNANLFGYTFTNQPLGAPFKNRVIVVGLGNSASQSGAAASSMSIAGVSATLQARQGPYPYADIWSAVVPTGETGTISVGLSGSKGIGFAIAIWSVYGLAQTATPYHVTGVRQAFPSGQLNLSVPPSGLAIVNAVQRVTNSSQPKGITFFYPELEMFDTPDYSTLGGSRRGASRAKLPENPIFTVQAIPASVDITMVGTTWR